MSNIIFLLLVAVSVSATKVELPEWAQDLSAKLQGTDRLSATGFARFREKVSYTALKGAGNDVISDVSHPTTPQLISDVLEWGKTLSEIRQKGLPYPYFAFLPNHIGSMPNDGTLVNITSTSSSSCFRHTSFQFDAQANQIIITAHKPSSIGCSDFYLLSTTSTFHLEHIEGRGEHKIEWALPDDITLAEIW